MWSTDKSWSPAAAEEQLEIFKISNQQQQTPSGIPPVIEPVWDDFKRIQRTIDNNNHMFTAEHMSWWGKFFEDPNKVLRDLSFHNPWIFSYLDRYEEPQLPQIATASSSLLGEAMKKERSMPHVTIFPHCLRLFFHA